MYIRTSGEIYFPPSPSLKSTFAYPSVSGLRCHLKTLLVHVKATWLLVCCWLTLSKMLFTRTGFCLWSSSASLVGPRSCRANLLWLLCCNLGLSFRCSVSYCYSSSFLTYSWLMRGPLLDKWGVLLLHLRSRLAPRWTPSERLPQIILGMKVFHLLFCSGFCHRSYHLLDQTVLCYRFRAW